MCVCVCVSNQTMIKFMLMVNRQGQTRLSRYYTPVELSRRAVLEADVVRCCLTRKKDQVTSCLPVYLSVCLCMFVCDVHLFELKEKQWYVPLTELVSVPSVPSWSIKTSNWSTVSMLLCTSWWESQTARWGAVQQFVKAFNFKFRKISNCHRK